MCTPKFSIALMLACLASLSFAEDGNLIDLGRELSQHCVGCHGSQGQTEIASHPNLAGQNAEYLVNALKAYQNGERVGGLAEVMRINSRGLSLNDIQALAAYYSSL